MIATKLLKILLLHQIGSSLQGGEYPLSGSAAAAADNDDLSERALWAPNNEQAPLEHRNNRHHHHDHYHFKAAKRRGEIEAGTSTRHIIDDDSSSSFDHDGATKLSESGPMSPHRHRSASVAATSTGRDRFWHNNRFHYTDWCSKDCELAYNNSVSHHHHHHHQHHHADRRPSICASDGRAYKSMCELKRHSCRHNVRLRRRPKTFCQEQDLIAATQLANSSGAAPAPGHDRVRIVELRKLCGAEEYAKMKRLLFDEFNGNLRSMFRYYDVNADNHIEAHELWPADGGDGKLIYAQVWDNHTHKCPHDDHGGDHSKCWYFLDFAFQPQYPKNPCSLSHLMLFDLEHPNHQFDYSTFSKAFANFTTSSSSHVSENHRLVKRSSKIVIGLGDNIDLKCRDSSSLAMNENANHVIKDNNENDGGGGGSDDDGDDDYLNDADSNSSNNMGGAKCTWTRYNSNLAASKDPHVSIRFSNGGLDSERATRNSGQDILLKIREAQLYLSGQYSCSCHFQSLNYEHVYHVQVLAKPRVKILPHYQWSLPKSRVSFECQYDQINTNPDTSDRNNQEKRSANSIPTATSTDAMGAQNKFQFGLEVEWTKAGQVLTKQYHQLASSTKPTSRQTRDTLVDQLSEITTGNRDSFEDDHDHDTISTEEIVSGQCNTSLRASIATAQSRLTLENLQTCDSSQYTCRIELPQRSSLNLTVPIVGQGNGYLLVQDRPKDGEAEAQADEKEITQLWVLHENGISIYKLQDEDGQEMELIRELSGHSSIGAEVEGNWNQLTLCGGLNTEQAVICEWSDNAVFINVDHHKRNNNNNDAPPKQTPRPRKYVYVGQPNLNRVVVFDSFKFEIVSIINTEPQPRRLHIYEPNKIHLSKWVKRRLSPIANARWESAIGTRAHSAESTPQESRLSSSPLVGGAANTIGGGSGDHHDDDNYGKTPYSNVNQTIDGRRAKRSGSAEPSLIQHDIWLLCYGQPLVSLDSASLQQPSVAAKQSADSSSSSNWPRLNETTSYLAASLQSLRSSPTQADSIKPFEPRLSAGGGFVPFAWPSSIWPPSSSSSATNTANSNANDNNANGNNNNNNKESRLRNRKSVHIIQSTFLPFSTNDGSIHRHLSGSGESQQGADRSNNLTTVGEFKRTSVISTHHIYPGGRSSRLSANRFHFGAAPSSSSSPLQRISFLVAGRRGPRYDLIQDLYVPQKPYSMEQSPQFKIHYAYVSHYDERRLFRVSMDNYRYDREIDLQDCDPIHMLTTAQGLIVVQCRELISHNLIGQLVLDQLTVSRIEFNANIRAQESYLSPDNRYLVSIFHDTQLGSASQPVSAANASKGQGGNNEDVTSAASQDHQEFGGGGQVQRHSSIVYVQTVTIDGLRMQYEIKTLFEISQCSFVWKDGYYAAIFVTTNRKDQQSEILSLRLIDSRLELMARVPGLVSATRHKEQLIVSPELRLAALTTNQGTFVIDLEENRVSQSLRPRHLSPPTLLWV